MWKNVSLSLFLCCLAVFSSCEKAIEKKKNDLIMLLITNGQWYVENFVEGTTTITDQFNGYLFRFYADGTVKGTKDLLETTGTWSADADNRSISSNFLTAEDPLIKFNGTWKIIDSGLDFVKAEMNTPQGKHILGLRKNP